MRIRKNANLLSSLMSSTSSSSTSHASGPESLQIHECQLNQSPWDVIPFSNNEPTSLFQFEGEDSFNGNGSLGDSIGAVKSVWSMMADDSEGKAKAAAMEMTIGNMVTDDNDNGNDNLPGMKGKGGFEGYEGLKIGKEFKFKKGNNNKLTTKSGGRKGYSKHCKKNEPQDDDDEEHDNVGHYPHPAKSHNKNSCSNVGRKAEKIVNGSRRGGRAKAGKKGSSLSSSNPYEFYYYSGFGPRWGKRRLDRDEGIKNSEGKDTNITDLNTVAKAVSQDTTPFTTPLPIEHKRIEEEFDYVVDEDDYDDDDGDDDSGKKRMRKLVKARSLKSLM